MTGRTTARTAPTKRWNCVGRGHVTRRPTSCVGTLPASRAGNSATAETTAVIHPTKMQLSVRVMFDAEYFSFVGCV